MNITTADIQYTFKHFISIAYHSSVLKVGVCHKGSDSGRSWERKAKGAGDRRGELPRRQRRQRALGCGSGGRATVTNRPLNSHQPKDESN